MMRVKSIFIILLCSTLSVLFLAQPGYASTPITGSPVPGMQSYDTIIPAFMAKYNVPGGAVAVLKDGRLVFARGYGYADTATGAVVQPNSLFRIASLSKQITAVTILKLVEEGRLSLDDKAFKILNLTPPAGMHVSDQRIFNITIRELLDHSGGWDSTKTWDPMFESFDIARALGIQSPPSKEQIIEYMMTQPLQFAPGTQFAYSNFGYLVLGRVIEKVTGQPYEDYVRANVLAPMGITDMMVGHTLLTDALQGEVHYYDYPGASNTESVLPPYAQVPWPYGGFYLEDMDSHGAWVASAIDIVRFAASVDGAKPPPFLNSTSIQTMTAPPPAPLWVGSDFWYGLGWYVREPVSGKFTWWHTGSLPGTMTIVVRAYDGIIWAALFNTRPQNSDQAFTDLDNTLWTARNAVTAWPSTDLFSTTAVPEFQINQSTILVLTFMITLLVCYKRRTNVRLVRRFLRRLELFDGVLLT
jgi:N-acyl-D-amino-acid deacylase